MRWFVHLRDPVRHRETLPANESPRRFRSVRSVAHQAMVASPARPAPSTSVRAVLEWFPSDATYGAMFTDVDCDKISTESSTNKAI